MWPDEPLGRLSPAVAAALRFALGSLLGLGPVLLAETGLIMGAIPGIAGLTFALLAVTVSLQVVSKRAKLISSGCCQCRRGPECAGGGVT